MVRRSGRLDARRLIASIQSVEQTYFLAEHREQGRYIDDEGILNVTGRIEEISPSLKRHLGRPVDMSFICSRRFKDDGSQPQGEPFLLCVTLKKERCGFAAFLPADAFWALPSLIASKAFTHIEANFDQPRYGTADLLSIHFATASELAERAALQASFRSSGKDAVGPAP